MVKSASLTQEVMLAALGFTYQIIRSRRRSLAIEVRRGEVVLRAPLGVAPSVVIDFLQRKADWVKTKVIEQQSALAMVPTRHFMTGASLPFLDKTLTLAIESGRYSAAQRINGTLHILVSSRAQKMGEEAIKRLVVRWYQQQALALLTEKTSALCQRMELMCTGVSIKTTRSKWGHCTSRGAIQYNWQILLAPEAIVDYLVAHEVSHLRHHNHSTEFWQLVASVCPDFKMHRAWLKAKGTHLML